MDKTIILASNSPRRQWLLGLSGHQFDVQPADVDEAVHDDELPSEYVARLAASKAREVGRTFKGDCVVIAADTTVADGNQILGKPVHAGEAEEMLRQLRGRVHQVFTSVAVYDPARQKMVVDVCKTDVPMRAYSDQEIQRYIESGDPMDKAGAYAIQHQGFQPVEGLTGCFANVVGLPLCLLADALSQFGIKTEVEYADVCKFAFDYECPNVDSLQACGS